MTNRKSSFEIIDFHIHPFMTNKNNTCFYEKTVETLEEISKDLLRAGISRACGSVIHEVKGNNFNEYICI